MIRPPAARVALISSAAFLADLAPFGVHAVGGHVIDGHGQEGARAHMERDEGEVDPGLGQRRHQRLVEMQARRGGRDRARAFGPDRLVILPVAGIGRAFAGDIGGQRHGAGGIERGVEIIAGEVEAQAQAALQPHDLRREVVREDHRLPQAQLAQRFGQRGPRAIGLRLHQRDLDLRRDLALRALAACAFRSAARGSRGCRSGSAGRRGAGSRQVVDMGVARLRAHRPPEAGRRIAGGRAAWR
jgi:hypothetical protein